jgi:CIC family chloride channel protein
VTPDEPEGTAGEDDNAGLLGLAASGLAVGALAGRVGGAFHIVLDGAHRLRLALLDWAHRYPDVGWLAPMLLAAVAAYVARWLVRRFAPRKRRGAAYRISKPSSGAEPLR